MAIIKCPQGHYYDDNKTSDCPYCAKLEVIPPDPGDMNEKLTSYVIPTEEEDGALTEAFGENVSEDDRTVGMFFSDTENMFTVGWLVCTDGIQKGKSYVIYSGRNFAGRSTDMDIVLSDDYKIKRDNHFAVVYDPKDSVFYFVAGDGASYVNGEFISSQCVLNEGDEITAGDSTYCFVPFCKGDRKWN
ncbi:MAG: FHA domain-containing protein [Clostridia bacterium]|nr:FHA domain-containing protein [Clostridia bacterium]